MELFPAVMIGGPPHSGKSVLAYSLTQALRARGVAHYVLRAYPDGRHHALVCLAVIAALVGAIAGQWTVTLFLGAGVAVHGFGWWYLYQRVQRDDAKVNG